MATRKRGTGRKNVNAEATKPKIGRPATGKRSNPDYRQVSAWIRRDTYDRVTRRLFLRENRREFSDLVQALLEDWLASSRS